jgi:hypothetical protein
MPLAMPERPLDHKTMDEVLEIDLSGSPSPPALNGRFR